MITKRGTSGTMIYNDAFSEFAGGRHPELLGFAVREGWPEVADFNDNVIPGKAVMLATGYAELPRILAKALLKVAVQVATGLATGFRSACLFPIA